MGLVWERRAAAAARKSTRTFRYVANQANQLGSYCQMNLFTVLCLQHTGSGWESVDIKVENIAFLQVYGGSETGYLGHI